MGVFEVRIWSGAGVSVLVCARESAFEMDWCWLVCFSRYYNITHNSLSEHACIACTNIVYSKELERDVTTTAKALLRLKTLA